MRSWHTYGHHLLSAWHGVFKVSQSLPQLMSIRGASCHRLVPRHASTVILKCVFAVQSLALAHADVKDDIVFFSPWKEKDFRTGKDPWWT